MNLSRRLLTASLAFAFALAPTALRADHTAADPKVSDAWVREALPTKDITAAFLTFSNPSDDGDAVVNVTCRGIDRVELHTMKDEGGMMRMERVTNIPLPAKSEVKLAPGGLHLMLFGLKTPVTAGKKLECEVRFEHAKPLRFEAEIRAVEGKADAKP